MSDPNSAAGSAPIAVSLPQIAYSYGLGYRMPGAAIARTLEAHLALCRRLGPARCQLLAMQRGSDDAGNASGRLQLRIATNIAQAFPAELDKAVTAAGGRAADASATAEDVSKDIVDADARIRQRTILVERLTAMLRNRQGRVGELVEAERSVAQAQEELDRARGWLGELRRRVAYSQFTIIYSPIAAPAPTVRTVSWSLGDAAVQSFATLIAGLRALAIVLIFLLPWALILAPFAFWFRRRLRRAGTEIEAD